MHEAQQVFEGMTYADMERAASVLIDGEISMLANMGNVAALIYNGMPDLNWFGFYLFNGTELTLGPFQGRPACARIALGKGVCGTAASERMTVVVPDVLLFPGHIACDANSRSEIVVPLLKDGHLLGVLDADSPVASRFGEEEQSFLERIAALLCRVSEPDWHRGRPPSRIPPSP